MCGRAKLTASTEDLRDAFGLEQVPELPPRYNIAPSQPIAVVRNPRRLELLRWGIPTAPYGGINARMESVSRAPAYRDAFRHRRCLVIVDGFYEWVRQGNVKQPFLVRRADCKPFALAGIWERSTTADGEIIESCAVITGTATESIAAVHDRMPIILPTTEHAAWLDAATRDATALLIPQSGDLTLQAVQWWVNNPANDDARCIEPKDGLSIGENARLF